MEILHEAWNQVHDHAAVLAEGAAFPLWTHDGHWNTIDVEQDDGGVLPHHGSWMVGDLPAILWFASSHGRTDGGHAVAEDAARLWSGRLENRATLRSFASVSHMFFRGALVGVSIGDDRSMVAMALKAAQTVSSRFREIGYMKSFGAPADSAFPFTTIDDVINLTVPIWLARQTNDAELERAAREAIELIAQWLIRPDGSVAQVLRFDAQGKPVGVDTYQGFSPDGCWSRGQAWGIYGFASAARLTGDARYVQLAERMTNYWIDHVQDDPSPLWDFDLPSGEEPIRDSFAATLAYAGVLELANLVYDRKRAELLDYGREMVTRLAEKYVLGRAPGTGLVSDAALDVPHKHGIGESVIVGDSYFVEALWRLLSPRGQTRDASLFPGGSE